MNQATRKCNYYNIEWRWWEELRDREWESDGLYGVSFEQADLQSTTTKARSGKTITKQQQRFDVTVGKAQQDGDFEVTKM